MVDHAEVFWLYAKAIALLLNLAGIYALQKGAARNTLLFWIAFLVYFAMVPAAIGASLVQLTNESSTLLFVVTVYALVGRHYFLSTAVLSPSPSGRDVSLRPMVWRS